LQVLPNDLVVQDARLPAGGTARQLRFTCQPQFGMPLLPEVDDLLSDWSGNVTQRAENAVVPIPDDIQQAARDARCMVARVATWPQLTSATNYLQLYSRDVRLVLTENVSIPSGVYGGHADVYPGSRMTVYGGVTEPYITTMNLGLLNNKVGSRVAFFLVRVFLLSG
jgi:hypothetical protein